MKLLIIGCPHSGTLFTASVLRSAGVSCGHEAVYSLWGYDETADVAIAEVSWEAVFYLGCGIPTGVVVAHQTRAPMAWLNSWTRMSEHAGIEAWALLEQHYPGISARHQRNPVLTSMQLWVEMNRRCEQYTNLRYRVEDLHDDEGAAILDQLCRAVDLDLGLPLVRSALTSADRTLNHHPGLPTYVPMTWGSLPFGPEFEAFKSLAEEYGYATIDEGMSRASSADE